MTKLSRIVYVAVKTAKSIVPTIRVQFAKNWWLDEVSGYRVIKHIDFSTWISPAAEFAGFDFTFFFVSVVITSPLLSEFLLWGLKKRS